MFGHLAVMAKAPRLGAVKTRLAAGIGAVAALGFYRSSSTAVMARLGPDPRWQTHLFLAPDRAPVPAAWAAAVDHVHGQGRGDLGARMDHVFQTLPAGPVIIVGADIPDLTAARVANGFKALGEADMVLGPAEDGGYWLIGARRRPVWKNVLGNVRWSSPHTLSDTLANIEAAGLTHALLETLPDIDTAEDLAGWRANRSGRPLLRSVPR